MQNGAKILWLQALPYTQDDELMAFFLADLWAKDSLLGPYQSKFSAAADEVQQQKGVFRNASDDVNPVIRR